MSHSILLQALRQLSPKERTALCAWADCSAFNNREEVARLCNYLTKQFDKKGNRDLQPETLFKAAFPKEKYNNRKLRHTMSYCLDLVRKYLIFNTLEKDKATASVLLNKAARWRGMDTFFEKENTKSLRRQAETLQKDGNWYLAEYHLLQEQLEGVSLRERSSKLDLHPLHDNLTAFYLAEMLRHATSSLTHQAISGQSYDTALLGQVFEMVEKGKWQQRYPPIAVYYPACKSLLEDKEAGHFTAWKSALAAHQNCFSEGELRTIYLAGINYCIKQLNSGQRSFIQEAFDLYCAALNRAVLFENGYLTGFSFKNIIRIAMALGEEVWTEAFFENYTNKLHPRERQSLSLYNRAYLHFQNGDYAAAMPMLQGVELEDRLNNLDARRMLLRSYFELEEWQALESLLESFAAYLKRQKDLGYHKAMYLNLIRFVRKIMENKANSKLRTQIEATNPVAEKVWLLNKIK